MGYKNNVTNASEIINLPSGEYANPSQLDGKPYWVMLKKNLTTQESARINALAQQQKNNPDDSNAQSQLESGLQLLDAIILDWNIDDEQPQPEQSEQSQQQIDANSTLPPMVVVKLPKTLSSIRDVIVDDDLRAIFEAYTKKVALKGQLDTEKKSLPTDSATTLEKPEAQPETVAS